MVYDSARRRSCRFFRETPSLTCTFPRSRPEGSPVSSENPVGESFMYQARLGGRGGQRRQCESPGPDQRVEGVAVAGSAAAAAAVEPRRRATGPARPGCVPTRCFRGGSTAPAHTPSLPLPLIPVSLPPSSRLRAGLGRGRSPARPQWCGAAHPARPLPGARARPLRTPEGSTKNFETYSERAPAAQRRREDARPGRERGEGSSEVPKWPSWIRCRTLRLRSPRSDPYCVVVPMTRPPCAGPDRFNLEGRPNRPRATPARPTAPLDLSALPAAPKGETRRPATPTPPAIPENGTLEEITAPDVTLDHYFEDGHTSNVGIPSQIN